MSDGQVDATYDARGFLHDGMVVDIRSVTPCDLDPLVDLHLRASGESIRRRFFGLDRTGALRYVEHVCDPLHPRSALVAILHGRIAGLVSTEPIDATTEEIAVIVDDASHGLGLGTLLLEHMATWARRRGVERFEAEVLSDNGPMLRVFRDAGFELTQHQDHGVVDVRLDLHPTTQYRQVSDWRERQSERASLRPLWEPLSVAVVGTSRRRGGVGREVVENILAGRYRGRLLAVAQSAMEIPGVEVVPAVDRLPDDLDLAIVAVPAGQLPDVVLRLAEKGTRACVILTAGLAETGDDGAAAERALGRSAREHGMRLMGPNCFGVVSRMRGTRLDATFGTQRPQRGCVSIGSQSGGVGIELLERATARNLGIAAFVSLGNKVDVSGNDLLAAWTDDDAVDVGALYLESFGNPVKFVRLARTFSRVKPLLMVVGGLSAAGARAGGSHTAASATPARALQAMIRASGIIPVDDGAELVDTAALLFEQPLPAGHRLGIVGNAGGLGVIAADEANAEGLAVLPLGQVTVDRLAKECGSVAGVGNPIDLGAAASPQTFGAAVAAVLADDTVDSLLVEVVATAVADVNALVAAVHQAVAADHAKPVTLVVTGASAPVQAGGATRFGSARAALKALARAAGYARWRSVEAAPTRDQDVRGLGRTPSASRVGWVSSIDSSALLGEYGIPVVEQAVVGTPEDAAAVAERIGFPIVVKTAVPDVVHKIERSLVRTNLADGFAVSTAAAQVISDVAGPVLVQRQVHGPELALGIVRDDSLGGLVMVATGGTYLSLWGDQQFLLPPISRRDARTALESLRTWPLLDGYRGTKAADTDALVDLVGRVGALALQRPDVVELDLNPVVVTEQGPCCVDVKLRTGT